jgi:hypothetical protein
MTARIAVLLGAILALALPASAGAALPKPSTTLIVPGKSIGGVALGATASKVKKAWGNTKDCEFQCVYEGGKNGDETATNAGVLLESPASGSGPAKVWRVFLTVGQKKVGNELKPDFNTPLDEFTTSKGIGIGSKISEVQKAYPSAKKLGETGFTSFTLKGKGEIETTFTCAGAPKVTSVVVSSHPGG